MAQQERLKSLLVAARGGSRDAASLAFRDLAFCASQLTGDLLERARCYAEAVKVVKMNSRLRNELARLEGQLDPRVIENARVFGAKGPRSRKN